MRLGIVGWRGMVGSVLMERMKAEGDFSGVETVLFSTSAAGQVGPDVGDGPKPLEDATSLTSLRSMDVIVTCQGGDYTEQVYPALMQSGFRGYWIDAASTLRMKDDAVLILDPVNQAVIEQALDRGTRTFVGANCTVSLMLMGIGGLFRAGWVEWVSSMTYQAASGAGARNMLELVEQMGVLASSTEALRSNPAASALEVEKTLRAHQTASSFPTEAFGAPLAASLLPWIDRAVDDGQTREEWKGEVEANKILCTDRRIPVDGLCVRVGSMRSHAQGLTIKLKKDIPLDDIEAQIANAHEWVNVVPNDKASTLAHLTPVAVSGTLKTPVGRLRKMKMGGEYLAAFTVGDQLLWGAAEPLRRLVAMLKTRKA
jgi:aspartate-semialdehyde dehydrogenase